MEYLNKQQLNVKFSLIILIISVLLLGIVVAVTSRSVDNFAEKIGNQRMSEEVTLIQQQFVNAENAVLADAKAIANTANLAEVVESGDIPGLRTIAISAGVDFELDDIDIVDHEGQPLDVSGDQPAYTNEDELLALGLIGVEATGIVEERAEGEESEFLLGAAVPIHNDQGTIVGAIFVGRIINDEFLADINFARSEVHLGFLFQDQLIAQHVMGSEADFEASGTASTFQIAGLTLDTQQVTRASQSGPSDEYETLTNDQDTPYKVAHVAIPAANGTAIATVLLDLEQLASFRQDTTQNIGLLLGAASLLILGLLSIAIWRLVSRPLHRLQAASTNIAKGNYSQKIDIASGDEIGQLAQTFNKMATAVREREKALSELNVSLEKRVTERTAELESATKEAVDAARLKDEFLSIMSHELRTPLNAIMGYLGLMELMGNLDEKNLEMTKRSHANAERLLQLINDILDISRIEAGRMELAPVDLHVKNIVARVQAQMQVLAEEKRLTFAAKVDKSVPELIHADEDAVVKILTNLLSNAIKFTQEGKVSLLLTAEDETLVITVDDTGIGIPTHMQQIIFDKFRQVDQTSTREFGGTGLGLNVVQQMATLMGGTVAVKSKPGKGSKFVVRLPKLITPVETPTPVAAKGESQ